MSRGLGSSLSFLLAGWGWLLLTSLLGLASFAGIVRGSPLPSGLRLLHVHGVLIGGLLQLMTGLAIAAHDLAGHEGKRTRHRLLFLSMNLAALGFAIGAWLRNPTVTLGAGFLLAALFVPMARQMMTGLRTGAGWTALSHVYFGISFAGLFGTVVLGGLLADAWYPTWHGILRLGHIHAGLLLFLTLGTAGTIQLALPLMLHHPLRSAGLGNTVMLLLPASSAGLITGFVLSSVPIQLAAGSVLLVALTLCGINLLRTWIQAGQPGSAATDHLLTAVTLLLIMTCIGLAVGINVLSTPPAMPYGTLHLVAYTHTAFLGFLLQSMVGGLSFALPSLLVVSRIANQKKRGPYREELERIMNRWRAAQVATVSFGCLGLVLVASLTWNLPLSSPWIQTGTWVSLGLLLLHLTMVTVKIAQATGAQPSHDGPSK